MTLFPAPCSPPRKHSITSVFEQYSRLITKNPSASAWLKLVASLAPLCVRSCLSWNAKCACVHQPLLARRPHSCDLCAIDITAIRFSNLGFLAALVTARWLRTLE